jgi:hypothetical protein
LAIKLREETQELLFMGGALRQSEKEAYWKPVLNQAIEPQEPQKREHSAVITAERPKDIHEARADVCSHCGTEFVVRSPYCRMCGWRSESYEAREIATASKLDFHALRRRLNLSIAALVCFIAGLGSLTAAATVGFIYSANTLVDWQAIQIWRIEWLLAAAVALLCGILLNRKS